MREQDQYEHGVPEYEEQPYNEPLGVDDTRDPGKPAEVTPEQASELQWMLDARQMYNDSTDYMRNSLTKQWEDNWRMFRNEHPNGSKYHMPAYKNRSKAFRSKLRPASTARISKLSMALHSNDDVLDLTPQNQADTEAKASAEVHKQLMQYRLENSIPWFQLSMGAFQSCDIYNVCISCQEWDYKSLDNSTYEPALGDDGEYIYDDDGNALGTKNESSKVISDKPVSRLVKPENFKFSASADWIDPVNSSPFLFEDIPMVAGDVVDQMEQMIPINQSGQTWRKYTIEQVISAGRQDQYSTEAVSRAREGDERSDPDDDNVAKRNVTVWVRRVIIRKDYQDYTFYTIGDTLMLTTPVLLETVCKIGRNYTLGYNSLEVFRNYPSSAMQLGKELQGEINDLANQRSDNVKLVLNKRYFIKRQKQGAVDINALMNNVPGGGVFVDDPSNDVKVIDTPDITGSSYQENDRLSVELDELLGNFSQSSVQSNRALNETVGGMQQLSDASNSPQEFAFMLFVKTWVEPTLRQLVKLEALYETDEVILALAGRKSDIFKKYGIDRITDELLDQDLIVKVNVGMGHTDPTKKLQQLTTGINIMMGLPGMAERIDSDAINKEAWGYLGFANGERFVLPDDKVPQPDPMADPAIALQQMDLERKTKGDDDLAAYRQQELDNNLQIAQYRIDMEAQTKLQTAGLSAEAAREKTQAMRDIAAGNQANTGRELSMKRETGSGI